LIAVIKRLLFGTWPVFAGGSRFGGLPNILTR